MEHNNWNADPNETRGWEIVKQINEGMNTTGSGAQSDEASLTYRKLLAEYFRLGTRKPSRLHSAILSCAAKMAVAFPGFHFVPFLDIWELENLRPEDSESKTSDDGKRFPSLCERMTKAYAYSLLFHAEERLAPALEETIIPILKQKGYQKDIVVPAIATRVFQSEVRNRKMTFVTLLTPDGDEVVTEVHTITQHCRMRYEEITNRCFRVLLRSSEKGNIRIEAAYPFTGSIGDSFPTAVGYVEHIDEGHHHIHIYDNESRHLVARFGAFTPIKEGCYVQFIPVIPKDSNFKEAIIVTVLTDGQEAFGYRDAVVTYNNAEQGYCAWELLPDADGQVHPIVETGAREVQEPGTKGYINNWLCERLRKAMPQKGDRVQIITFLKRGKDKKKRPVVVDFRL